MNVALKSTAETTNQAASLIAHFAATHHFGPRQRHEIELAVREAVANAVVHGNRREAGKRVFLAAEMQAGQLVISIRDEGDGFDPASVPNPLDAECLLRESGRGLFLVRAYMDEVIWRPAPEGGTEITLTKYSARRIRDSAALRRKA